jgi:hypothetical protein
VAIVSLPLAAVTGGPEPELGASLPCCPPLQCRYTPSRVQRYLRMIRQIERDGGIPCEALAAYLRVPDSSRAVISLGPARRWAADIVADLAMARQAGCADATSIAEFLCPFALVDEERCAAARAAEEAARE